MLAARKFCIIYGQFPASSEETFIYYFHYRYHYPYRYHCLIIIIIIINAHLMHMVFS